MDTSETGAAQGCTFSSIEQARAYSSTYTLVLTSCSASKDSPYSGETGKWKNFLGFQNKSPFRQI